jgi:hypothetical protein
MDEHCVHMISRYCSVDPNVTSDSTPGVRCAVPNKMKIKETSSVFSSGFSGYLRVRPPEPKREVECKEGSGKSEGENPDKKLAPAS